MHERTAENKGIFATTPEDREAENEGEKRHSRPGENFLTAMPQTKLNLFDQNLIQNRL